MGSTTRPVASRSGPTQYAPRRRTKPARWRVSRWGWYRCSELKKGRRRKPPALNQNQSFQGRRPARLWRIFLCQNGCYSVEIPRHGNRLVRLQDLSLVPPRSRPTARKRRISIRRCHAPPYASPGRQPGRALTAHTPRHSDIRGNYPPATQQHSGHHEWCLSLGPAPHPAPNKRWAKPLSYSRWFPKLPSLRTADRFALVRNARLIAQTASHSRTNTRPGASPVFGGTNPLSSPLLINAFCFRSIP